MINRVTSELRITNLIRNANHKHKFGEVQPFVFTPRNDETQFAPPMEKGTILATPFTEFSIEMEGRQLITQPAGLDPESGSCIQCIYVKEIYPGKYNIILCIGEIGEHPNFIVMSKDGDYDDDTSLAILGLVEQFLQRIHTEKSGIFKTSDKVRLKQGILKRNHKFKSVIYISPNNTQKTTPSGRHIDWKHSWSVRGHFRRLKNPKTMGRDRQGNLTLKGYTWVKAHVKGDGPLSEQVRKIQHG